MHEYFLSCSFSLGTFSKKLAQKHSGVMEKVVFVLADFSAASYRILNNCLVGVNRC